MRRLLLCALAALAPLLASPIPALAAGESNATLPDIEDEVMCTVCGTALQLANSPQAERERAFINDLISQGKTKEEIKDALVEEYGPEVLAVPKADGFDLTAWLVPIGGILIAVVAIGLAARRWRRSGGGEAGGPDDGSDIDSADAERLRADLGRYEV